MRLSFFQAICWITISIPLISGPCFGGYFLYKKFHRTRLMNPSFQLTKLITPTKVHPNFFCEVLSLHREKKIPLYAFDLDQAKKTLLQIPIFKEVFLKRHPPNSLYVDCELRKPIAILLDYENTAIDREGYLFPYVPFFQSKKLPKVYLGLSAFNTENGGRWNEPLEISKWKKALEFFEILQSDPFKDQYIVGKIDVSQLEAKSYGRKEIVIFLTQVISFDQSDQTIRCYFPKVLRFHPKNYRQQLKNFLALSEKMLDDYRNQMVQQKFRQKEIYFSSKIFDFRIAKLGFVDQ